MSGTEHEDTFTPTKSPRETDTNIEIGGKRFTLIQAGANQLYDMGFYGHRSRRIYIDFENSPHLQGLYGEIRRSVEEVGGGERAALEAVYGVIGRTFTRGEFSDVLGYFRQQAERADKRGDLTISLDEFVGEGIGNCVQTTLTSAVLLERLKRDGLIEGDILLDRYEDEQVPYDHVWCEYRSKDGRRYMVDLILGFVGDEEAFKPKFREMVHRFNWSY